VTYEIVGREAKKDVEKSKERYDLKERYYISW